MGEEGRHRIHRDKLRLIFMVVATLLYIVSAIVTGSILVSLYYIFMLCGILVYSDRAILGLWLIFISEICSMCIGITETGIQLNYNLIVLFIATVITILKITNEIRKGNVETGDTLLAKLKAVINYKIRPNRLSIPVKLILYSTVIIVIIAMTKINMSNTEYGTGNQNLTLLTSMWLLVPNICALLIAFRCRDAYVFMGINQIILGILVYMQVSLGNKQAINGVYTICLMFFGVLLGYMYLKADDIKLDREKRLKEKVEEARYKELIKSIDKLEVKK